MSFVSHFQQASMKRVAVIGAGPGGLAALRHLAMKPELYSPKAYEKASLIGGMWNYTDATGKDENGFPIHPSIYKNLTVNAPTDLIRFSDFPYGKDIPALCEHEEVRNYMENYANHFDLKKYIQFNTVVTNIRPIVQGNGEVVWEVQVNDVGDKDGKGQIELFDVVLVANGANSAPYIPDIPGLNEFKGKLIHSFDYRTPEEFVGMRVAILGGPVSGQDITVDVSQSAKDVIFINNAAPLEWDIPANVSQSTGLEKLSANKAFVKDGSEFEIDALILCTGYRKHLPFISQECGIKLEDDRLFPLFKHIINTEFPTMAFIGYCQYDVAISNLEFQVKFVMAVLDGRCKLPSKDEMNADIQRDLEKHFSLGMPVSKAHHLGFLIKSYHHELANLAGIEPLSPVYYQVFNTILEILLTGLSYRQYDFKRDPSGEIDIQRFKEYFSTEKQKSTCGGEEIDRRLKELRNLQNMI